MVLRNVAKTFSLEEQRQEINEIAVDLDAVNTTLTNWNASQWDTAYGWGDHALAGYLVATTTDKTNWNTAFGWGDHASAGYLTAYQTDAQIKTSYEANADTNAFTDAFQTKLNGIEAGATADQTAAEIRTLVGSASDSNVFTDALQTKLSGIETGATADQTGAEIKTAYEGEADTNAFTDAEQTKLSGIEAGATVNAATGGTSGGLGTQADPQYGSVQFRGGTNTLLGDSVFVYETTNNKLGIGIQQPKNELHILKGVDGGDVSLRITNQSSVDAGTTASMYLGTSPSDTFNTFYIRTFRESGATHLGYADPDAANHDPNIILPSAGGFEFGTQTDTATSGSTKSSATLDHYEEGTWTPEWGSTTGSITNVTYNVQSGWYTRIGRVVYVHCRLRSTATDTSGAGGGLLVNGLPFVARTPQGTGAGAAYSLIDFPAGTINITTEVRENTTQFYAGLYTLDNGNFGNIGPGSLQSSGNSEIRVSFFYMTDS